MKCNKCNNEYPSQDYFKVNGLCNSCYEQMSEEEKIKLHADMQLFEINRKRRLIQDSRIGFGRRFGAYLLDIIIIGFINMIILGVTGLFSDMQNLFSQGSFSDPNFWVNFGTSIDAVMSEHLITMIFLSFIGLFYMSLEIILGASVGKLILGIQIANEDGKIADKSTLAYRFAVKNASSILSLFAYIPVLGWIISMLSSIAGIVIFIGYFFIFTESKMCLHDRIAKTAVFRKRDLEAFNQ